MLFSLLLNKYKYYSLTILKYLRAKKGRGKGIWNRRSQAGRRAADNV
jgi:hypothetical protein